MRPRKAPTQERAQATVAAITQAAALLAHEKGYAKMTTNLIAQRAGISIGSLYQYFPNRDAILMYLYEETSSKIAYAIKNRMVEVIHLEFHIAIPRIVELLLDLYDRHQLILLRSVESIPHLRIEAEVMSVDNLIHSTARTYLEQHADKLEYRDPAWTTFMVENTLLSNIRAFVTKRPPGMLPSSFVAELSRLIINYIVPISSRP